MIMSCKIFIKGQVDLTQLRLLTFNVLLNNSNALEKGELLLLNWWTIWNT